MNSVRTRLTALADSAVEALRTLVSDPSTPPSVRLRAVTMILNLALDPDSEAVPPQTGPLGSDEPEQNRFSSVPPVPYPGDDNVIRSAGAARKPGRNEDCPCGSGLKYKKCCLNRPIVLLDEAELLRIAATAPSFPARGAPVY